MPKPMFIETKFYNNGHVSAQLHKVKPEVIKTSVCDVYVDPIRVGTTSGSNDNCMTLKQWIGDLIGVENKNILFDDLIAGRVIDITNYC